MNSGKYGTPRAIITIVLALSGVAAMILYAVCDTSCSYLKGDIFGIDLKYLGIGYMLAIIALVLCRQRALVRILLAAGIGVEVHLVAFQIGKDIFCPYCLAFGVVLLSAFVVNYEKPRTRGGGLGRIISGLGEVELPPLGKRPLPLLPFVALGYLFAVLTFTGSVTATYGGQSPAAPSYAEGPRFFRTVKANQDIIA